MYSNAEGILLPPCRSWSISSLSASAASVSSRQAVGFRLPGLTLFLAGSGIFPLEAFPASHHAVKAARWHDTFPSLLLHSLCWRWSLQNISLLIRLPCCLQWGRKKPKCTAWAEHRVRHLPAKGLTGAGDTAGWGTGLGTGRTAAARGWHGSLAMLLTPPAPGTLLCAGPEVFQFRSAGGRWRCAMHGCRQSIFFRNSGGKNVLLLIWGFWGATQSALTRTQVGPDKSSVRMCCERPPHSSYCVSGILAKVLSGRSRPHSLSWWRQERIMALTHVVCSPCWDHVHSPAGLMLVSVTPPLEYPPAPPLAMSHGSKSTLLLKEKPKNKEGKQEIITAMKKHWTPFEHQLNL